MNRQLFWIIKSETLIIQMLVDDGDGEGRGFVESEIRIPLLPDGRINMPSARGDK